MIEDIACPWCQVDLPALPPADAGEQTCPECLTSWTWLAGEPALDPAT
jgi:hypothetical protein